MNNRVIAAFCFGGALLLAAYTFSDFSQPPLPSEDSSVEVVTAKAPTREYIPTQDSNDDGIPDWQDVLLNTTPLTLATSSARYEAPTTLTDQLAVTFFEGYLRNKSYGQFGRSPEELVKLTNDSVLSQTQDLLYTTKDIIVTRDNSLPALKNYGNQMALAALALPTRDSQNEIDILQRAVNSDNESVLEELDPLIADYELLRSGFLAVAVPTSLAKEHLDLVNSTNAILGDITAMKVVFSDPLLSLLRIQRYQDDSRGLSTSIVNLQTKLKRLGVTYGPNDPAAQVIIIE